MKIKLDKIKKIVLAVVCVIISCLLCACSPITLTTVQTNKEQVVVKFNFDLSQISQTNTKIKAYNLASTYYSQLVNAYKNNLVDIFSNVYNYYDLNLTDLEQQFTYVTLNNPKFLAGGQFVPDNVSEVALVSKSLDVEITFMSIYGYIFFFCPKAFMFDEQTKEVKINSQIYSSLIDVPITSIDTKREEGLFVGKFVQTCSPFSYNGESPVLLENYVSSHVYLAGTPIIEVATQEFNLTTEQVKYVFNFVTPYKRLHSDGKIESTNDGYVHTWEFDNLDGVTKVWRNSANYIIYYLTALGTGLLAMAVAVVIVIINNKKKSP